MREAQLSTLFNSAFFELKKSNYICVQQPNELEFGLPNQLNFFFFIPETFRALSEHFFFYLPEMFDAFLERNVLTQLG